MLFFRSDVANEMDHLHLHSDDDAFDRRDDVIEPNEKKSTESEKSLVVERGGKFDFVENDHLNGNSPPERALSSNVDHEVTFPPINTRPKSAPTRTPPRHVPRRPDSAVPITNNRSRVSCKYTKTCSKLLFDKISIGKKYLVVSIRPLLIIHRSFVVAQDEN